MLTIYCILAKQKRQYIVDNFFMNIVYIMKIGSSPTLFVYATEARPQSENPLVRWTVHRAR